MKSIISGLLILAVLAIVVVDGLAVYVAYTIGATRSPTPPDSRRPSSTSSTRGNVNAAKRAAMDYADSKDTQITAIDYHQSRRRLLHGAPRRRWPRRTCSSTSRAWTSCCSRRPRRSCSFRADAGCDASRRPGARQPFGRHADGRRRARPRRASPTSAPRGRVSGRGWIRPRWPTSTPSAGTRCASGRSTRPGWDRWPPAEPNPSHVAIARMEQLGYLDGLITQNIDRLHRRAGSVAVAEVHGSIDHADCLACGARHPYERAGPEPGRRSSGRGAAAAVAGRRRASGADTIVPRTRSATAASP